MLENKFNNLFKPLVQQPPTGDDSMGCLSKLNEWAKNYKFKEKNPLHPKAIQPFFLKFEMAEFGTIIRALDAPDFQARKGNFS